MNQFNQQKNKLLKTSIPITQNKNKFGKQINPLTLTNKIQGQKVSIKQKNIILSQRNIRQKNFMNKNQPELENTNLDKNKTIIKNQPKQNLIQRYQACMILSAVGDAMGYKNGEWQFNTSGKILHKDMMKITNGKGPLFLQINMGWRYSDDTVMHIATAQALLTQKKHLYDINKVSQQIALQYKNCVSKMPGRAPGRTCMKSIQILNENADNWNKIPYNQRACGCGGSMRSACIGLTYWRSQQKEVYQLIKVSIEAGRITHHNPIGYLGSMVASYFTALAVRNIKPHLWVGYLFEEAFPLCQKYILEAGRQSQANLKGQYWKNFIILWEQYAKQRNISKKINQQKVPKFPQVYDVQDRQNFYKKISFGSWPGATGIDSVLIAYDALIGCKQSWEQFCLRGIIHGGDNDSTGAIGGAWFGTLYGFKGVPDRHYKSLQDCKKLQYLGQNLFKISHN